jgi:ribonuclease HI
MRKVWPLKQYIPNTGKEWLFQALDQASEQERMMMFMTFWRIWHVRNEVVHQKPPPSIEASRRFLCSYVDSLLLIKQAPMADPVKGKTAIVYERSSNRKQRKKKEVPGEGEDAGGWSKPPLGWTKLNVDGAWNGDTCEGGTGMVLRDEKGNILVAGCTFLQSCDSPLQAEVIACNEGIALARMHTSKPIIVESDCQVATSMINDTSINRSQVAVLVELSKKLCRQGSECQVRHICREYNGVSHTLARWGCNMQCTNVWIRHGPDIIRQACNRDGTPIP